MRTLRAALEPDAVVIDPHMPRLDGFTAIVRLRRDYPNICLIALTGDSAPALHQAAGEAGADGVFVKGEFLEKLLARLVSARVAESRQLALTRAGLIEGDTSFVAFYCPQCAEREFTSQRPVHTDLVKPVARLLLWNRRPCEPAASQHEPRLSRG